MSIQSAAVHWFLVEHNAWQSSGLLRAHVGETKVQIRGALERLQEAGLLERVGQAATGHCEHVHWSNFQA